LYEKLVSMICSASVLRTAVYCNLEIFMVLNVCQKYYLPYTQIFSRIKIAAKSANWVSLPQINFRAKIFLHVWFEFYRQRRSRDLITVGGSSILSASATIEFIWWFCHSYPISPGEHTAECCRSSRSAWARHSMQQATQTQITLGWGEAMR
jgi:hypothetical protein